MAISPQRNKYNGMAAYKNVKTVQLRCLKDGSLRTFLDDGPFPLDGDGKPVPKWELRTPQSGRSQLIKKMRQRESDPLPPADDPEATIHLFVFEGGTGPDGKPLPLPRVWDPRVQDFITPARMTDHHREVMALLVGQRNARVDNAKRKSEERRREEEARTAAATDAMFTAIAERMSKVTRKSSGGSA